MEGCVSAGEGGRLACHPLLLITLRRTNDVWDMNTMPYFICKYLTGLITLTHGPEIQYNNCGFCAQVRSQMIFIPDISMYNLL